MKILKTFYKGNYNGYDIAIPGKSQTVFFSFADVTNYANLIAKMSEAFIDTEYGYQNRIYKDTVYISFVIPGRLPANKFKQLDSDTILDRFFWFVDIMASPSTPCVVSVWENNIEDDQITKFSKNEMPWDMNKLWYAKQTWNNPDSNYVVLHPHGETTHMIDQVNRSWLYNEIKTVVDIVTENNLQIRTIDYTTSVQEAYDLLLGCKCYFGYHGSTSFLADLMRVPSLYLGTGQTAPWNNVDFYEKPDWLPYDAAMDHVRPISKIKFGWGYQIGHGGYFQLYDTQRKKVTSASLRTSYELPIADLTTPVLDLIKKEHGIQTYNFLTDENVRQYANHLHDYHILLTADEQYLSLAKDIVIYDKDQVFLIDDKLICFNPRYLYNTGFGELDNHNVETLFNWVKQYSNSPIAQYHTGNIDTQNTILFDLIDMK